MLSAQYVLNPVRSTERKMFRTREGVKGSLPEVSEVFGSWIAETMGVVEVKIGDGPLVVEVEEVMRL